MTIRSNAGDKTSTASWVAVNDYEARLLTERTGLSIAAIAERVQALVVTHGAEGSAIHAAGRTYSIAAVKPDGLVDPTGCGDAYRAGLLYGIAHGLPWQTTGRLAALLGAQKIASRGGQNHSVSRDAIAAQYHQAFGEYVW